MRHPIRRLLLSPVVALSLAATHVRPVASSQIVVVATSASISARAALEIAPTTLTFRDAQPDRSPALTLVEGLVSVTTKARTDTSAIVALTLTAAGEQMSDSDAIPASNLRWAAAGIGFRDGTLDRSRAQPVGSWIGSGTRSGTLAFTLANEWLDPGGACTLAAIYTLTSP